VDDCCHRPQAAYRHGLLPDWQAIKKNVIDTIYGFSVTGKE